MIKPSRLKKGDRVAVVSLSSGLGGEDLFRHRYQLGVRRMEEEFGLHGVPMPNALKGLDYLDRHPQARADDFMAALQDPDIRAVFSMTGGEDAIRLLPYVDLRLIREHPKVFLGYSDTTVNHFMMHKAGVVSYYGPAILSDFAENVAMHRYTKAAIRSTLLEPSPVLPIVPSPQWTCEFLDWAVEGNNRIPRAMQDDPKGFLLLQGAGVARGKLLGGCLDVLPMLAGTSLWPSLQEWEGRLLFLETSEECISPGLFRILLRSLAAQGVLDRVSGILLGKPMGERHQGEYHAALQKVVGEEVSRPELPVLANINFGHNAPMCILPYGVEAEIDCEKRSITLLEPPTAD